MAVYQPRRQQKAKKSRKQRKFRGDDDEKFKGKRDSPSFSGKSEVSDFLKIFTYTAELNGWSYRESGLQLATSLKDDAAEVLSSMPGNLASDYASLKAALRRRYDPSGREGSWAVQLWGRVCKKNETIAEFGHAVRRLGKKAYPHTTLQEQFIIDIFVRGLPSKDLKRHVHLAQPGSLDEAISLATTFQAFEVQVEFDKGTRKPRDDATTHTVETGAPAPNPQQATEKPQQGPGNGKRYPPLRETLEGILSRLEQLEESKTKQKEEAADRPKRTGWRADYVPKCFNCGKPGHMARGCPQNSKEAKPDTEEQSKN